MKIFGGPFGHSPFQPLLEHYLKIETGALLFLEYIESYGTDERKRTDEMAMVISGLEEEADRIKDETRRHISSSLFAAVIRPDILLYLSTQDDIADHYNHIVTILRLRKTSIISPVKTSLIVLAESALKVVFELGELLKAALDRKSESNISRYRSSIPRFEHNTAEKEEEFLRTLFRHEEGLDPVSIVILMSVAEDVTNMAKRARNSSDILYRMLK